MLTRKLSDLIQRSQHRVSHHTGSFFGPGAGGFSACAMGGAFLEAHPDMEIDPLKWGHIGPEAARWSDVVAGYNASDQAGRLEHPEHEADRYANDGVIWCEMVDMDDEDASCEDRYHSVSQFVQHLNDDHKLTKGAIGQYLRIHGLDLDIPVAVIPMPVYTGITDQPAPPPPPAPPQPKPEPERVLVRLG